MSRLKTEYREQIVGQLKGRFGYHSIMQVPRIEKVTLNMGVGEAIADKKVMDNAVSDLRLIAGQQPIVTKARKSVAAFKIREGWPIGCKVTLRRERMYEFLDRLINVAIPRIRDFDYDKIDALRGLDITITTTARSDDEGRALLEAFKFPFRS